ncbi:MAG: Response regulator receiver domain [Gaiellales bacterium]|jgi:DNA-binding NarL/FixJ family response regulator|nr:Response regulator receiver domain [Gaiellales bacterium]
MAITTQVSDLTTDTIRVLVADASGPGRLQTRQQLQGSDGCAVVAEAVTAKQAVAVAAFEQPDVVVLHPDLPNEDGIDLVAELEARLPRTAVLIDLGDTAGLADAVQRVARPAAPGWI